MGGRLSRAVSVGVYLVDRLSADLLVSLVVSLVVVDGVSLGGARLVVGVNLVVVVVGEPGWCMIGVDGVAGWCCEVGCRCMMLVSY